MRSFLLCHLYGPMQSWGGIAVGQVRGDEGYPSKSAFLGLCAAALGIKRSEEERHRLLHNGLAFAVHVRGSGFLLRDYHTAQVPSTRKNSFWLTRANELAEDKLNTVLSTRDYRADALYTAAVWERGDGFDLNALVKAFKNPVFSLSLGRKSCPPALPIQPVLIQAENLNQAFLEMKPPASPFAEGDASPEARAWTQFFATNCDDRVYCESPGEGLEEIQIGTRRDALVSRERWSYQTRQEYHCHLKKGVS